MTNQNTEIVSRMKEGACRLFAALVVYGCSHSTPELMGLSGIRKRDTYFAALRELEDAGLIHVHKNKYKRSLIVLSHTAFVSHGCDDDGDKEINKREDDLNSSQFHDDHLSYHLGTGAKASESDEPQQVVTAPKGDFERQTGLVTLNGTSAAKQDYFNGTSHGKQDYFNGTSPDESDYSEGDYLSLIVESDSEEGPFKRKKQEALLIRAWKEFFPQANELAPSRAKKFLISAGDIAEFVYQAFEKSSGNNPENPVSYVQRVIENMAKERKERSKDSQTKTTPSTSHGKNDVLVSVIEDNGTAGMSRDTWEYYMKIANGEEVYNAN